MSTHHGTIQLSMAILWHNQHYIYDAHESMTKVFHAIVSKRVSKKIIKAKIENKVKEIVSELSAVLHITTEFDPYDQPLGDWHSNKRIHLQIKSATVDKHKFDSIVHRLGEISHNINSICSLPAVKGLSDSFSKHLSDSLLNVRHAQKSFTEWKTQVTISAASHEHH